MDSSYQELNIEVLTLDIKNPRISQYLDMYGDNISAEGIALALTGSASDGSTSFSALRESIYRAACLRPEKETVEVKTFSYYNTSRAQIQCITFKIFENPIPSSAFIKFSDRVTRPHAD